jgi:hypothetical protein
LGKQATLSTFPGRQIGHVDSLNRPSIDLLAKRYFYLAKIVS